MNFNTTRAQADIVIPITLADAKRLPNMLGVIVPLMLKAHGYYTATIGGRKTLYVCINQPHAS